MPLAITIKARKGLDHAVLTLGKSVDDLEILLESANKQKDRLVFDFIKTRWPRHITPNHLTVARMFIGMLLGFLLFNFKHDSALLILPLFFTGALTDLLDGVVARGFHKETVFGQIFDPIADRALLIPIFFYSLVSYNRPLFFFIIVLEIVNALISVFSMGKNISFGPNIFGKTKMVLQSAAFIGILLFWPREPNLFFIGLLWLSLIFMAISIIFKLITITVYYETGSHKNLQYPFGQKRIIKAD